ncbi:MAG: bifunctional folylpolyglutamate synthase/dihydrofolate synthase [Clostridia bacterium]|nr:bifunctional folylpolyglutamate synthase/dihydrofolate synthase [Clostridia bacterium]
MTYQDAENYVHSLLKFGIKPGLERINELLSLCGNPQGDLRFVHVAGTNGKGTTSTFIANILSEAGYKTGLFTSPYVKDFLERIQIDGKPVSKRTFAYAAETVRQAVEKMKEQPTEFEVITAAAMLCYKKEKCDIVVLEVGLGGRYDATNIIGTPLCCVITSVSLDHTQILGDTVSKIASEKCGIIKEDGITVTSSNQNKDALEVIEKTAEEKNNKLIISDFSDAVIIKEGLDGTEFLYNNKKYKIALTGAHQVENALNAVEAAKTIEGVSEKNIKDGLKKTVLPARMQIINTRPLTVLDGGHNEGCALALERVLEKFVKKDIHLVIGMMADKDCEKYLSIILPLCKSVTTVMPDNPRSIPAKDLAALAKKYCNNVFVASTPKKAKNLAEKNAGENGAVVICGSFYLAGEYL